MTFPDEGRLGAWVNLLQADQVVENALEQRLKASTGVSLAEFEVLSRLSTAGDGRLTMTDIASLLLASKSGVTRIVDRLVDDGLVSREVPPENRRVVYARITPHGTETLGRATSVFVQALEQAFSRHLSDADVRALRRILRKLLEGNGVWEEQRCSLKFAEQPAAAGPRRAAARR